MAHPSHSAPHRYKTRSAYIHTRPRGHSLVHRTRPPCHQYRSHHEAQPRSDIPHDKRQPTPRAVHPNHTARLADERDDTVDRLEEQDARVAEAHGGEDCRRVVLDGGHARQLDGELEDEAEGDAPEVGGDDEAFFPAEEGGERRLAEECWGVQ